MCMSLYAELAGIKVGRGYPVRVVGVINLSPESFYKASVKTTASEVASAAQKMVEEGADAIDVGAMSTAPYLETFVSVSEEIKRLIPAIRTIREAVDTPVSADTFRGETAERAIEAGAQIVNDVTGLKGDPVMAKAISNEGVSGILMAHERRPGRGDPIERVRAALKESLEIGDEAGISRKHVVVDPGIGFFRETGWKWYEWDTYVLRGLRRLHTLGRPIHVAVSRKSFIGALLNQERPEERLIGSLAAAALAVYNGAYIVRTHDVRETVEAVRLAEKTVGENAPVEEGGLKGEILLGVEEPSDVEEVMMGFNVYDEGARLMGKKGVFKIIALRGVSNPLALILKQEMLAAGGEAALPKGAILCRGDRADVLAMGTLSQLERVAKKLERMSESPTPLRSDLKDVSNLMKRLIHG